MKIKNLKLLIKNYTLNSIFTHYMLMLTPLFLIIFFIITFTITKGINSTEDSRNQTQFDIDVYRIRNNINTIIKGIPTYHSTLSDEFNQILSQGINNNTPETANALKTFTQLLNNIKNSNPNLASIYVYSKSHDYVYTSASPICASNCTRHFLHNEVFDEYFKSNNTVSFNEKTVNNQKYTYMSVIYPIITGNTISSGYIAYNIDIGSISDSITHPVYVFSKQKLLFSANSDKNISAENIKNSLANKYAEIKLPDLGTSIFIVNNYKTKQLPFYIYVLLILLVILLSLTISCIISYSFYYKIDSLCSLLKNPFSSSKEQTENVKHSEISYIADNIKSLILSQDNAKKEIADKLRLLSEAQATALQFQISPHFLFNTLNLVNSIAMQELKSDTKVISIIDSLSQILYDTLDISSVICTIEREIEYTKNYLEIQKYKYDNFTVQWNIPNETLSLPIVRFTLQPIIENALHHGIFTTEEGERKITISSFIEPEKKLHIMSIKNTGEKIPSETVEKINRKINDTDTIPTHSIGLWNTNKRIKLLFGNEFGCAFSALPEGGAEITIILPLD